MATLTVHLTPPLTGVKGEMWVMFVVGGTGYWYYILDIPLSVNGTIGPFSYADGYPINIHQIRFPEQTINGVTYLETQTSGFMTTQDWTFNITLTPTEEPSIPTTLTISAPPFAYPAQTFPISGILYETGTGVPIPNKQINLSDNGVSLGSATTGIDGDYLKQVSIPAEGVYTLKAEFPRATGYTASSKTIRMGVGVPLIGVPYIALAPIVTGLALAHILGR